MNNCSVIKKNLGLSKCDNLPSVFKGMITAPDGFSLTPAEAADVANWNTAILGLVANRVYLWPWFKNFKDNSEKAIYEETDLGSMLVRQGRNRYNVEVKEALCVHKAMYTHGVNSSEKVFFIDSKNQIFGTLDSAGNFTGFDLQLFNVEKLMIGDGKNSTKTPIYIVLEDNTQMDLNGWVIDASSFINDMLRVVDVELTIVSHTNTEIKFTVKAACDGTSLNGLVKADVKVSTALGVDVVYDTLAQDAATGVYTATKDATDFVVGDKVNLVAASALTIQGFESTGAVALT